MPGCSRCVRARPSGWRALASDWLGMQVEVVEFAGAWLPLPPDQRTRLSAQRRLVPARASMPRPACAPGIRRRASSCASARSTCQAFQRLLPDRAGAAPAGVAGARLCRLRDWASRSIRCWRRDEVPPLLPRRDAPIRRRAWAGTPGFPGRPAAFTAPRRCGRRGVRGGGDRGAAGARTEEAA